MFDFIFRFQIPMSEKVDIKTHDKWNFHCCTLQSGKKGLETVNLESRLDWIEKLLNLY